MTYILIQCPWCLDINQCPADSFRQGQHEHCCTKCYAVFMTTRDGDTVTTRKFNRGEKPQYPEPYRGQV